MFKDIFKPDLLMKIKQILDYHTLLNIYLFHHGKNAKHLVQNFGKIKALYKMHTLAILSSVIGLKDYLNILKI